MDYRARKVEADAELEAELAKRAQEMTEMEQD